MAKKKASSKKAPRQESGNMLGWVIAAIIVIAILFFVMRGKTGASPQTAPVTAPTPGTLTESTAPTFGKKCVNAIGVVPGTQEVTGGVLTVTFKNNGRSGVEGTYFEFSDASGVKRFKKNSDAVASGATIKYSVDLNQVASELGSAVKSFVIYPIEGGLACENQRRVVLSQQ